MFVVSVFCSLGLAVYVNASSGSSKKKSGLLGGSSSGGSGQVVGLTPQPWPSTGNKHVLVCGGAGYIGTHTIVSLLASGYDVTVIDR